MHQIPGTPRAHWRRLDNDFCFRAYTASMNDIYDMWMIADIHVRCRICSLPIELSIFKWLAASSIPVAMSAVAAQIAVLIDSAALQLPKVFIQSEFSITHVLMAQCISKNICLMRKPHTGALDMNEARTEVDPACHSHSGYAI